MDELEYLLKEYSERIDTLTKTVAYGTGVNSFDDYQYVRGQIRGLSAACFLIEDLRKHKERSDNE